MPPPGDVSHLPSSQPASRQKPKSPNRVLAECEAQWLFTEAELANTPSIQDGMTRAEEQEIRAKGVNFIVQVGIMLKLPQLTLSTAAIFFQRFLMRASLKRERDGIPKLHHYQTAATALFLATKVEESCRKMREMILAFCRVAQKNPNLVIDEQSKDWWRWRDCILFNEDVLLEVLCFDLTVESPHRQLFDLLKYYSVEHNKRLRNQAWAFVTDSNNTQLCLLCTSRTIAVAALYAACRFSGVALPDDAEGRPWWETQHVRLEDMKRALVHMCANYETTANRLNGTTSTANSGEDGKSIYHGLATSPDGPFEDGDVTRQREDKSTSMLKSPRVAAGERRLSNASSLGGKREREGDDISMSGATNGASHGSSSHKRARLVEDDRSARDPIGAELAQNLDPNDGIHREEALRIKNANERADRAHKDDPTSTTAHHADRSMTSINSAAPADSSDARIKDNEDNDEMEVDVIEPTSTNQNLSRAETSHLPTQSRQSIDKNNDRQADSRRGRDERQKERKGDDGAEEEAEVSEEGEVEE